MLQTFCTGLHRRRITSGDENVGVVVTDHGKSQTRKKRWIGMFHWSVTPLSKSPQHLDLNGRKVMNDTSHAVVILKIELRNLKAQLFCLGGSGEDADLMKHSTLFSRIENAIASILLQEIPFDLESDDLAVSEWVYRDILSDVSGFAKQLADEWNTCPLAVDEVVGIAGSILENVADFLVLVQGYIRAEVSDFVEVDVFDAIEAQLTFLKGLLVFAKGTGAELQDLLIHIQTFAINAARVFINDQYDIISVDIIDADTGGSGGEGDHDTGGGGGGGEGDDDSDHWYGDWYEEIHYKCSALIRKATASEIYQAYSQALSTSTFSSTPSQYAVYECMLKNFLHSLISFLWDVLRRHPDSRIKDQLKMLYERLRCCRAILKRHHRSHGWKIRDHIGALICGAAMLVCSLHHAHVDISFPEQISELLERFDVFQIQFGNNVSESSTPIAEETSPGDLAYILEDMMVFNGNDEETAMPQHSSSACFQDDEVNLILDRLRRGSKQLQIVPICGMAGVGKTSFASALFNHRSIIYHFQARAWCTISQVLDKKKVLVQLLDQLSSECGSFSEMTEDDLANKLRQSLKGKRYLVVLDDVWTTEAWHNLEASFPDDSTQSRVVLTSRHHDIVPNQQPYLLRLRDDDECLEILQRQLSHKKGWTSELGMTAAKLCKGLPLTAVVVAGLLGTTKQQGWKGILDHLILSGVSGEKQCNSALELSFKHLPDDLKLCFLYFAAFPEDEEISVKRLLRLWIGEGLVRESESKRAEDVAGEYMEKLIQRSLVTLARNSSIGGARSCRIHDLIHDFCQSKAKQENFFHILSQGDDGLMDFNEPCYLQRLSIHSDSLHFKEARLFCPAAHSILFSTTQAVYESYLFDMLFIVQIYKLLHVLDISMVCFSAGIPNEVELLVQLRYLSIRSKLGIIPSSLGNLPNLETLIGIFWCDEVMSFPHTFWNLHKLKWLHVTSARCLDGFALPIENLENTLLELETLCTVAFYSYGTFEQQLRKFPNIRRLKCSMSILPDAESTTHSSKVVISDFLNQLRCLTISGNGPLQCEFGLSENLRRLSLRYFEFSKENVSDIGKLPNLEVLKLQGIGFCDDTLDMKEGEFSKLRYLRMIGIRMKRWTVSDEQLSCLKKLLLYDCRVLEELPSDCLTTSSTLEVIKVRNCSGNLRGLAREIEEVQKDYGNFVKVRIEPVDDQLSD